MEIITTETGKTTTGKLVVTHGVNAAMQDSSTFARDVIHALRRYVHGDWGTLDDEDWQMNDDAITTGNDRIFAAYETTKGKIYIITEWDRSYTTVLFPKEY